jgi:hypothetical protein
MHVDFITIFIEATTFSLATRAQKVLGDFFMLG